MSNKKTKSIALFSLLFLLIILSVKIDASTKKIVPNQIENAEVNKTNSNIIDINQEKNIVNEKKNTSEWIIKGSSIDFINGRRPYNLDGREINSKHFVVRITTPENPFEPHKHKQSELWFIIEGKGKVLLNGKEYDVEKNDLIILDPWVEHRLTTTSQLTWICLG